MPRRYKTDVLTQEVESGIDDNKAAAIVEEIL